MSITCTDRNRCGRRARAMLYLAAMLALLGTGWAAALPDDREQPIQITADSALRDEKQGFTVYTGNVHMVQGSLQIDADKLTIYHENEQADRVVAEGAPARMQQQPDVDEAVVHARAENIEYLRSKEEIYLRRNAYIDQDGATVTGDSIVYFINEQKVQADAAKAPDGPRVITVIPPQMVRDSENGSGAAASQ